MAEPIQLQPTNNGPPRLPVKDCPDSQAFKCHTEHKWEKKPGWFLWCEGVLPLDEQPPCQMYVSPDRPECGDPAPTKIRVKTRQVDARIDVCVHHRRRYDNIAALRRASGNQIEHRRAS